MQNPSHPWAWLSFVKSKGTGSSVVKSLLYVLLIQVVEVLMMMISPFRLSCSYVSRPITTGIIEVYFIFISALLILFQPKGEIKWDIEDANSNNSQVINN